MVITILCRSHVPPGEAAAVLASRQPHAQTHGAPVSAHNATREEAQSGMSSDNVAGASRERSGREVGAGGEEERVRMAGEGFVNCWMRNVIGELLVLPA
jgi:hypothetical protein